MESASFSEEPFEITEAANATVTNLLPARSKKLYEAAYHSFKDWCLQKSVKTFSENVMLVYFSEKAKNYKCSTVWAQYSMVRSCMLIYDNIDISKFRKLVSFLKRNSDGYAPKKSKILNREEVKTFLSEADDDAHLMRKVVLIFGISVACRTDELVNLTTHNVNDMGSSFIITLPFTKNKTSRTFVITGNIDGTDFLHLIRKYAALRPETIQHQRFFIFYKNGKCTTQPVGKNTLGKVPSTIASFLKLPNPQLYTGHCLRRSSTTLLADAGADITTIKRHGGWKSTTVAESYIENCIANKINIANRINQGDSCSSNICNVIPETSSSDSNMLINKVPPINFSKCENITFSLNINNVPF
ncbi:uncharacterized protein LOC116162438 [Photinus pyralis]|uniref:uncharacterized protein LOC116162438 n=1 Tax=Photinus pyralis TaxID=7054 RepID=UPI0012677BCA|nr:uncharacterized protein LOC116162438 [Photinus pyralis]